MSSPFDQLLKNIPIRDIAKQLGLDSKTAKSAISDLLPTLIGGMADNVGKGSGADDLTKALSGHQGTLKSRKKLANVDTADGDKIVSHVFGSRTDEVVQAVSKAKGVGSDVISKILPMIAPIVISWLADKFFGKKSTSTSGSSKKSTKKTTQADSGSGGIGDLLGGLLGGSGGLLGGSGGDVLGGLLGGLLGGKS